MKKNVILAVLITFCLTVTLFSLVPSKSATGDYDPWADINDDGTIDIRDVSHVARLFGTNGEAINKTELLLGLQAQIDSLNASLIDLTNRTINQSKPVEFLEDNVITIDFHLREDGMPITGNVLAANFTWIPETFVNGNTYRLVRIIEYFEYMFENKNESYYCDFSASLNFNDATVYQANSYFPPSQFTLYQGVDETLLINAENYTVTFNTHCNIYIGNPSAEELATMHIIIRNIHVLIFDLY